MHILRTVSFYRLLNISISLIRSRTMFGFCGIVDNARLKVDGDVRAINLKELNDVFDRMKHVVAAMMFQLNTTERTVSMV